MFAYFENLYPWNMAVLMALDLGGHISEIDEACRPLRDLAQQGRSAEAEAAWCESWSAVGRRVRGLAERDAAAGHSLSAGGKMRRAAVYFLMAERMTSHHDESRAVAKAAAMDGVARACAWRGDAVQRVLIPYRNTVLPALFAPVVGTEPAPCMIQFGGFDVAKEFLYLGGVTGAFAARGIGTLVVDQPGVGEALDQYGLPAVKESEWAATAALDWLQAHRGVDRERIGIIAPSLGGYFAPRAAAFEHRLACCVAWGARWDNDGSHGRILRNQNAARSLSNWLDHAFRYYGTDSVETTATAIAAMTLAGGVAERIRCPILVAHGANDRQVPIEQASLTIEHATGSSRRDLRIFTADEGGVEHVGIDNTTIQADFIADWVADILAGPVQATSP